MDILSFIHVAIELGMKAIKAPTNYQEVMDSIIERYSNQHQYFLENAGMTKLDLSKEMQVAGSPSQKAWNNFVYNVQLAFIAIDQMQVEMRQIYDKIAQREKRAAAMQTLEDEYARVAQFWEQLDLNVELKRLLDIQKGYFEQSQSLLNTIQTLGKRIEHIDVQIMQEVKKIQEITHERINMAENIIQESTQKDIASFGAIQNELDKVKSKYDDELTSIRSRLQQASVPPKEREELLSKEAKAMAEKAQVEQVSSKISDLSEKSKQFYEINQKELHDLRSKIDEATDPVVHEKLSQDLSERITVAAAEKSVLENQKRELLSETTKIGNLFDDTLKNLLDGLSQNNIAQQLKDVVNHRKPEENESYDKLGSLFTTRKDIQKEIEENLRLHQDLEGKMRQNDMHIRGFHREFSAKLPQQLNNVTSQPKI